MFTPVISFPITKKYEVFVVKKPCTLRNSRRQIDYRTYISTPKHCPHDSNLPYVSYYAPPNIYIRSGIRMNSTVLSARDTNTIMQNENANPFLAKKSTESDKPKSMDYHRQMMEKKLNESKG